MNLIFMIVVPMVYVSITCAVGGMADGKRLGHILLWKNCTLLLWIEYVIYAYIFSLICILFGEKSGGEVSAINKITFLLIATIGILIDAPGTCVNAAGDTVDSMMVARIVEGKEWLRLGGDEKYLENHKSVRT